MFKGKAKQSEWMKGLLAAESIREGGYNLWQLSDYLLREGDLGDFWQGFNDYIDYCEEITTIRKVNYEVKRELPSNRTQYNIPRVTYE